VAGPVEPGADLGRTQMLQEPLRRLRMQRGHAERERIDDRLAAAKMPRSLSI